MGEWVKGVVGGELGAFLEGGVSWVVKWLFNGLLVVITRHGDD